MTVNKIKDGSMLKLFVEGRVDTVTAKEFEDAAKSDLDGVQELVLDLSKLDYISSAGLRVLLSLQKTMNKQGSMKLTGVNETVNDIFEVTGFSDILTIEAVSSAHSSYSFALSTQNLPLTFSYIESISKKLKYV